MKVWKTIKSLINFKPNKVSDLINHNINGKISSNPLEVANHFNKYFITIASKVDKRIIKSNKKSTDFLINPNEKTFSLHLTTPEEVQDYLKNIDLRKSVGPSHQNYLKNSVNYSQFQSVKYLTYLLSIALFQKR